jgi:hypothetical protein
MHSIPDISPNLVRDYAKALGWSFVREATADGLYILNHPTDRYSQVALPIESEAPDYGDALEIAISRLAAFEDTTSETVIENLVDVDSDRFRFRLFRHQGQFDSVPLSASSVQLDGIRKLLLAGACSEVNPRHHHPRLSGSVPDEFINACRIGHTEPGSFIWKVSCPIGAVQETTQSLFGPFTRRVTKKITAALSKLNRSLVSDELDILVEEAKGRGNPFGITSNLCDALLNLFDASLGNHLEISPSWAVRHPLEREFDAPASIRFLQDQIGQIEEVQRELTPAEQDEADEFIGTVEKLEGEMNDAGQREGTVLLNLMLSDTGESVRVRTWLRADDHATAIRAYETEGAYVRVKGLLRHGRQPRTLDNPEGFILLDHLSGR